VGSMEEVLVGLVVVAALVAPVEASVVPAGSAAAAVPAVASEATRAAQPPSHRSESLQRCRWSRLKT